MFKIAIVGRPNVGKSTLFNKLVGKSVSIVDNSPGITRDRKIALGYLGDMSFEIIDTAGWDVELLSGNIGSKMLKQTEFAIIEANLCLFIVDGREGIVEEDRILADKLRRMSVNVILVINKCENVGIDSYFGAEYYKLGLGDPVGISAEHKDGFNTLYEVISPYYEEFNKNMEISEDNAKEDIHIAVVGKQNSGKSTLINRLLGEERVIADGEAGTTRDSISIDWEYKGQKIKLVDTAGLRKKRNITDKIEELSANESLKAIKYAQVVIMMIDMTKPLDTQELSIISILVKEGRGVVFTLNKLDIAENRKELSETFISTLSEAIPEVRGCPIIPISALKGENISKLMDAVFQVYKAWNTHIPTSKLNSWLKSVEDVNSPPLFRGSVTKLKYIAQIKNRPPTFKLFTNSPERLEETQYDRFIVNSLRRAFGLENTVIRLILKKSDNPFGDKKSNHK